MELATTTTKKKAGDSIRAIAAQLRAEREIQIQATARLLSAASRLAILNDRIVDEVSETLQSDLD